MIHTTFRVNVCTSEADKDLFDTMTLCSVFKCASSTQEVIPDFGLAVVPEEEQSEGIDLEAVGRRIDEAAARAGEVAGKAKEAAQQIGILNRQGKLITPEAMDIYRETFVMRKSFGIANTERTNIDTQHKQLPRILPEDVSRYFPTPSAEQLAKAMTAKPRTKRQIIEDTLSRFPRVVPSLGLRVSLLHRPIWERDDEVARSNWKKALRPQLHETLNELQKDLVHLEIPNNVSQEVKDVLRFDRLDLKFDNMTLSVANEDTNRFGEVEETLEKYYQYLNDGAFGDKEVIRVDAPFINYDLLQLENEGKKARYEEELAAAEEAARLQAEREEQWRLEAEQSAAIIDSAEEAARLEADGGAVLAESADEDVAVAVTDEVADEAPAPEDAEAPESEGEAAEGEAVDGEEAEEGEDAEGEEAEEEINHYMGKAALLFAQRTVREARVSSRELARQRAEAAEEKARLIREAEEQGISLMPELGDRVWGIIYADGSIAYFDSSNGTFCEMPEPEVEDEAEAETEAEAATEDATSLPAIDEPADEPAAVAISA